MEEVNSQEHIVIDAAVLKDSHGLAVAFSQEIGSKLVRVKRVDMQKVTILENTLPQSEQEIKKDDILTKINDQDVYGMSINRGQWPYAQITLRLKFTFSFISISFVEV